MKVTLRYSVAKTPRQSSSCTKYLLTSTVYRGIRTIRRGQFVAGQFVADNSSRTIRRGQFVADNSSRTIRRGQLVAKYDINVTGDI